MLLTNELTKPEAFPQGSVCDWASAGDLDGNKEEEEHPALTEEAELTYRHS